MPPGMTETSVSEIFSGYGTVVDTKVLVSDGQSTDGSGQSVAIIRMGSPEEADWLVANLNGNIPQGLSRAVEVSYAGSRPAGNQGSNGGERYSPYPSSSPYAAGKPPIPAGMVPAQGQPHYGGGPPQPPPPSYPA